MSFFEACGIPVVAKDILKDAEARREFHQMGCLATPVIVIDGKNYVGFNEDEMHGVLNMIGQ